VNPERLAHTLQITELLYRYAELVDAGDFDGCPPAWENASN